ncbi:MAG: class I tRNA ligase family protein, partial [Pyrinomonadaceae bacterium]
AVSSVVLEGVLSLPDRWILSRLNRTARDVNADLERYNFHEAVQKLYHFFWDDYCDWYIELSKDAITAEDDSPARTAARSRILSVLEQALRLLHPFMPYLTEELWFRLPGVGAGQMHPAYSNAEPSVMLTAFPLGDAALIDDRAEADMQAVIELISRVRNIRSEMGIKPSQRVTLLVGAAEGTLREVFAASKDQIAKLARADAITVSETLEAPQASARAALSGGAELAVPLEGLIDFAVEAARLTKERDKLQLEATKLEGQLSNASFVERAPAEKVTVIRERLAEIGTQLNTLAASLEALQ